MSARRSVHALLALSVAAMLSFTGTTGSAGQGAIGGEPCEAPQAGGAPQRIISVVPALTEILFDMSAGSRVVAVSSFDKYPAEVSRLPRVGALLDPDLEAILALRPDLVVVYASQSDLRAQLDRARVRTFVYAHAGLADISRVMRALGRCIGLEAEADRSARRLEGALENVRAKVGRYHRPRTLLVFGRDRGQLRSIHASGGIGFLHDVLDLAGGANVFADVAREAVQASIETVLAREPEVIVELRIHGGDLAGYRRARSRDLEPSRVASRGSSTSSSRAGRRSVRGAGTSPRRSRRRNGANTSSRGLSTVKRTNEREP